jgi:hypothetical protein
MNDQPSANGENDSPRMQIPLVFDPPTDVVTRYATNFVIQCMEHEFILSFYEAIPPVLLGSPEENRAALAESGALHAQCVARIVVTHERMHEFASLVRTSMDRFAASQGVSSE